MALKISNPLYASRVLGLRALPDGKPASLNEAERSVEVVASTEEPALVWDCQKCQAVPEVLLMQGCRVPTSGQTPLLDTHSRYTVSNVLGSFRKIRNAAGAAGAELVGRMYFADATPDAEKAWQLVRQGHVTDVSVCYEINAHVWVEDGQTTVIEGREFSGPLRVVTDWTLFELSLCPIGADSNAKIRQLAGLTPEPAPAAGPTKENAMAVQSKSGGKRTAKNQKNKRDIAQNIADGDILDNPEDGENLELVDGAEYTDDGNLLDGRADDGDPDDTDDDGKPEGERKKGARASRGQAERIRLAERARISEINEACEKFGIGDNMRQQLVNGNVSASMAKAQILDMVQRGMGSMNPAGSGSFRVESGATGGEKFRSAALGSLMLRAGVAFKEGEQAKFAGALDLRSFSLKELARECLRQNGQRCDGGSLQLVGRALTTTDLPHLLVEVQQRVLLDSYQAAKETWAEWMGEGTATDFKETFGINLDADLDLVLKRENDEYRYAKLGENAEKFKVNTYGRKLVITREAIINDDLDALSRIPRLAGEAAAKSVGDIAYESFLDNPNMMDGQPLFSAAHGNIFAAQGGAPTIETLGQAYAQMAVRETPLGKPIGVNPVYFIAPVSLMVAAEGFFGTELAGAYISSSQATPVRHNMFGGSFFTRIYDRRIDLKTPNTWYLAGPKGTSVLVYFLNGEKEPYMESDVEFNTDNVAVKVRLDVGAAPMSHLSIGQATPA